MPQFAYKARRRTGEVVQGVLDVADRAAALTQIERLGLFPVMVDVSKASAAAVAVAESRNGDRSAAPSSMMPAAFREALQRKRKPILQDLATFSQQLSILLNCGMPLTDALQSMTHLETNG